MYFSSCAQFIVTILSICLEPKIFLFFFTLSDINIFDVNIILPLIYLLLRLPRMDAKTTWLWLHQYLLVSLQCKCSHGA